MKLNTLLNLDADEDIKYMEQEIYLKYNGVKAYYTIKRDEEGEITDIEGYNHVIKQIDNNGKITIANNEELLMDKLLSNDNRDIDELGYLIYEMYINEEKEFTCKILNQDYTEQDITFKVGLLDCIVTIK